MPVYWCGGSLEAGIVNLIETFNFAGRKKERKGKKKRKERKKKTQSEWMWQRIDLKGPADAETLEGC